MAKVAKKSKVPEPKMSKKDAKAAAEKEQKKDKPIKPGKGEIVKASADLPVLNDEQIEKQAHEDDKRFRELDKLARTSFAEMCIIVRRVEYYKEWRFLKGANGKTFKSRDAWLSDAMVGGRASNYAALRGAEKVLPFIPQEEFKQLPRYAIEIMSKVPKLHLEKQDSPIRKAASGGASKKELIDVVKKHAPEAHVEETKTVKVEKSAMPIVDDARQACFDLGLINDESEFLEYLCTFFLDAETELEMYKGMSNREASNAHKMAMNAEDTAKELTQEPVNEVA